MQETVLVFFLGIIDENIELVLLSCWDLELDGRHGSVEYERVAPEQLGDDLALQVTESRCSFSIHDSSLSRCAAAIRQYMGRWHLAVNLKTNERDDERKTIDHEK